MSQRPRIDVSVPAGRGIYCNRTLNMRSISVIGYDMDYTLIHYNVEAWERLAFEFMREKLLALGWPVESIEFDPEFVIRGLIIDKELGNIVKANRFGYVKRARHGSRFLDYQEQRRAYSRTVVDLSEPRWAFLNTFFSLSEACMYAHLVDAMDEDRFETVASYRDLYAQTRAALDEAHMEGQLKAQIMAAPDEFVVRDPDTVQALVDQQDAGKKLAVITNSGWVYTKAMMEYAFDPYLPEEMTWRDLFEVAIVAASKPTFFVGRQPLFEVVDDSGLLRPTDRITAPGAYLGGTAVNVEEHFDVDGSEVLYMGDHVYSDVHVSKGVRRWRTGIIVRELEEELIAVESFGARQDTLDEMMREKVLLELEHDQLRLELQRRETGGGSRTDAEREDIDDACSQVRAAISTLDSQIAPLARAHGRLNNEQWGLLMRTGNDKSHMARQIERHADIYTSRVSNLLFKTPYVYLRSHRGSLPHDHFVPSSHTVSD